jgi:hypothetical protein
LDSIFDSLNLKVPPIVGLTTVTAARAWSNILKCPSQNSFQWLR